MNVCTAEMVSCQGGQRRQEAAQPLPQQLADPVLTIDTVRRFIAEVIPQPQPGATRGQAGDTGDATEEEPEEARLEAAGQGPDESVGLRGGELDVEAHVGVALARIMAAAGDPPAATGAGEEERGEEGPQRAEDMVPMDDDEVECTGSQAAPSVRPEAAEVAERAQPKAGGMDTCRHWGKGLCMRADACRFAHPQPPVPSGVHHDLPLLLETIARVGAIRLSRSSRQEELLRDVMEAAQSGGLPAVGYAFAHAGKVA